MAQQSMFRSPAFALPVLVLALAASLMLPAAGAAAQPAGAAVGAVYAMTDAADGNEIAIFDRAADGTLSLHGYAATGGLGIGDQTEPVDALGSQAPLVLSPDHRWLLAVNAGSDQISVFEVSHDGLTLTDLVPSGGFFPASLALHGDLLYVLNSGGEGNVTGFRLGNDGRLTAIPGSTRSLQVGGDNPPFFLVSPAEVAFDPRGRALVLTIKGTDEIRVYRILPDGRPAAQPVLNASNGSTPFGFAFDSRGRLHVAEPFGSGSVGQAGASAVSSYELNDDGTLTVISGSVDNFQTASCWLTVRGRFLFVTNNGSDTVSGYRIAPDGTLSLLNAGGVSAATGSHPVDLAVSTDGRFLYAVDAGEGTVSAFRIDAFDGSLTALGTVPGLPADAGAVGIAVR